jgi:hypothetical protein
MEERRSIPGRDSDFFLFATASRPALGSSSVLSNKYRGYIPSGKTAGA